MARRTEEQRAVLLTEGGVVGVDGDGVGRGLLDRVGDVVADAETLLVGGNPRRKQRLELLHVFGRDGEVDARHAVRRGVCGPLDQMLFGRLARPFGIGVEGDQPLGLRAVAEPLADDAADDGLVVGAGRQHGLQFGPESELLDVVEQRVDTLAALVLVDELEELLEHARRGARRRHELHHAEAFGRAVVAFGRSLSLLTGEHAHAVPGRGGADDLQKGESPAEIFELLFHGLGRESVLLYLKQVFGGKHGFMGFGFRFRCLGTGHRVPCIKVIK